MFEALVVTLREGVEAALVVGIIVAFLRKEGEERYLPAVWGGIAAAVAGSFVGAWALYRWAVDEEAFEGVLYLTSALVVGSMVIWMWRHGRAVAGEVKGSLARILARRAGPPVAAGLALFTFLMVFREGIETVLFLSALSLTTRGLLAALGAAVGLAAAVLFGVLFVRGSLRVDLGRFFKITGIALSIFVLQLLVNGYHELSEAGWLPADERTMAAVGPLVRNEFFFLLAVLILPLLMLLVPGRDARPGEAPHAAAARLQRAAERRQRRGRLLGGALGVAILVVLGAGLVYGRPSLELSPAAPVVPGPDGAVRIPLAGLAEGKLARFRAELPEGVVRFVAIRLGEREVATAFDACLICGARGYAQDGAEVSCLHCGSAIYPPSIGQPGGCNPVPLRGRVEGGTLVLAAAELAKGARLFAAPAGHAAHRG
ncbi:MAG TPA: Fe-S-containing protein [Thermoanaerobaculia bacterium]|nr:Fe-S-containing protein [Thermoanaerobaculia bacterium]